MAIFTVTDEEYAHIKGMLTDILGKVQNASPSAAKHYATIAQMHARFLAIEDGRRAKRKATTEAREAVAKAREARRNHASGAQQKPPQAGQSQTGAARS